MISEQEARDEGVNGEGKNEATLQLKKGPWTAEEDEILIEHVRKYGEGRWSAVQKYSGLARCGKSCRLRWANHLRPDLKKGSFTPDEERLILDLQAKYGNKWARIAAELPGRTDNEIKNFWNSRIKRRLRDPNQSQGQQSYSSQPTTPTTPSSNFQFQVLSSPLPPRSSLSSTSSSSLPFTINRSPPLLSSPARFKRYHRLSDQTPTGFTTSPSMSSTSTMSQNLSMTSSLSAPSSTLISPRVSQMSPMISPLFSSMPSSPLTPQSPALFSTLSQPNSPRLTSLTRPNSRMHSTLSMPNLLIPSQTVSQVLSSPGTPSFPMLSMDGSTSPMLIPGENSSSSFIQSQQASEMMSGSGSFMFDGVSSDASGYLHNSELPSNQLSQMNSYDMLLEDPSQSDVIMDLKMKAGWTRGLKKKTRLDIGHGSKKNMAMARGAEEYFKEQVDKANCELMKEHTKLEGTFDSGQSQAELQDSCGLFEDMLRESQTSEATMTSAGTGTCLVFSEEKPNLFGLHNESFNFSHLQSSAGGADRTLEEQALEQMKSMHDDLSKLLEFDPSSLAIPELYSDCGEITNTQCSGGRADISFSHEMHQLASVFPLDNTSNQKTSNVTCTLNNFPGMQ